MLFDVEAVLVKKLAREGGLGKRDLVIRSVKLGPNTVTYVGARSEEGLEFVQEMREKLPVVEQYGYDDDDERDDSDGSDDSDDSDE